MPQRHLLSETSHRKLATSGGLLALQLTEVAFLTRLQAQNVNKSEEK